MTDTQAAPTREEIDDLIEFCRDESDMRESGVFDSEYVDKSRRALSIAERLPALLERETLKAAEPSKEAIEAAADGMLISLTANEYISVAEECLELGYAIDVAPLIAERDALKDAVAREGERIKELIADGEAFEEKTFRKIEGLNAEWDATKEEMSRLIAAVSKENDNICQALGKALGYPWFKDDQANFPQATEENGVCVGDHVAGSIAEEAAKVIPSLTKERDRLAADVERLKGEMTSLSRLHGELIARAGIAEGERDWFSAEVERLTKERREEELREDARLGSALARTQSAEDSLATARATIAELREALVQTGEIALALLGHFNPTNIAEGAAQQWFALHDQITVFNAATLAKLDAPIDEALSDNPPPNSPSMISVMIYGGASNAVCVGEDGLPPFKTSLDASRLLTREEHSAMEAALRKSARMSTPAPGTSLAETERALSEAVAALVAIEDLTFDGVGKGGCGFCSRSYELANSSLAKLAPFTPSGDKLGGNK